ncbi:STAS-like domain-containing protein [Mesobacillus subterraneus]|uniref:STAS-like domain-containing protein n=1 Tax=Mesobacillus subterraneus TaxID=285983 RepID=UPI001CFF428B|nr:STAS-like domain-containing protein [Mesobacillus subterraneus]WLR54276.1 STAS-like domain-containing protein [Mesobacillus subterraneus]
MVTIRIKDHVGRCYSNHDGKIIQAVLKKNLQSGKTIIVSFNDIGGVTSSFVNTAFIELLNEYDFSYIKKSIRFVNSTKQINDMIKSRFAFETQRRRNLQVV